MHHTTADHFCIFIFHFFVKKSRDFPFLATVCRSGLSQPLMTSEKTKSMSWRRNEWILRRGEHKCDCLSIKQTDHSWPVRVLQSVKLTRKVFPKIEKSLLQEDLRWQLIWSNPSFVEFEKGIFVILRWEKPNLELWMKFREIRKLFNSFDSKEDKVLQM